MEAEKTRLLASSAQLLPLPTTKRLSVALSSEGWLLYMKGRSGQSGVTPSRHIRKINISCFKGYHLGRSVHRLCTVRPCDQNQTELHRRDKTLLLRHFSSSIEPTYGTSSGVMSQSTNQSDFGSRNANHGSVLPEWMSGGGAVRGVEVFFPESVHENPHTHTATSYLPTLGMPLGGTGLVADPSLMAWTEDNDSRLNPLGPRMSARESGFRENTSYRYQGIRTNQELSTMIDGAPSLMECTVEDRNALTKEKERDITYRFNLEKYESIIRAVQCLNHNDLSDAFSDWLDAYHRRWIRNRKTWRARPDPTELRAWYTMENETCLQKEIELHRVCEEYEARVGLAEMDCSWMLI